MSVRAIVNSEFTLLSNFFMSPAGAVTTESASFDDRLIEHGHRVLMMWRTSGGAGNTGGVISIVKSATTGGVFTPANVSQVTGGNPLASASLPGIASWLPEGGRPFTRLRFVGVDAASIASLNGVIASVGGMI